MSPLLRRLRALRALAAYHPTRSRVRVHGPATSNGGRGTDQAARSDKWREWRDSNP